MDKPRCPECGCTATVVSNHVTCDDSDCAYTFELVDE